MSSINVPFHDRLFQTVCPESDTCGDNTGKFWTSLFGGSLAGLLC